MKPRAAKTPAHSRMAARKRLRVASIPRLLCFEGEKLIECTLQALALQFDQSQPALFESEFFG
ncbi:MAG: hypothetical protein CMN19_01275 [Roseovarius sp.]|nr:hypothetical protein [Roseovarius sp.]